MTFETESFTCVLLPARPLGDRLGHDELEEVELAGRSAFRPQDDRRVAELLDGVRVDEEAREMMVSFVTAIAGKARDASAA